MLVSVNMAMSMDGKIATKSRGPMKLGTRADSLRMSELRAQNDAVINGAGTFRAYPFPLLVKSPKLVRRRMRRGQSAHPISAIVSSDLRIPRRTPWEKSSSTERWVFCGSKASRRSQLSFEKNGVKVIRCRGPRPSPEEILHAFSGARVKKVLLEGGGDFNASFLEAGLIDQVHLTLAPLVIGGRESPSWIQGQGYALGSFPRFRLKSAKRVKDELFLTYRRAR